MSWVCELGVSLNLRESRMVRMIKVGRALEGLVDPLLLAQQ